jgi:tRNA A-37 threonylcarbamoyl transferase component Bud32
VVNEAASPATTLSEGAMVGNYRVERKIGEGGMGAVYLATHPLLGRKAAIKVLLPEHSRRPDLVTRFFNEAKTTASLHHPALVEVFDFGFLADGAGYLAMDFLEGESLADRLARVARLPADAAGDIARQIAAGVAAAHGQGIVHRDLKPDNVFLVPDPERPGHERVKILDFGIAKLMLPSTSLGEDLKNLRTSTGMLLGTPLYMAPEQCRGSGQVDHRADIYSVGCILFTLLTGRPPFDLPGVGEVLAAHLHEPVVPPRTLEPSVPPRLEAIVLRSLAKDPDARFQTMAELGSELQRFLAPPAATPAAIGRPAAGRPGPTVVGGFALVVVAVIAGVYLSSNRAAQPPSRQPGEPSAGDENEASQAQQANQHRQHGQHPDVGQIAVEKAAGDEAEPPTTPRAVRDEPSAPPEPLQRVQEPQDPAAKPTPAPRPPPARLSRGTALYRQGMSHRVRGEEAEALLAFRGALAAGGLNPADKIDAERQSIGLRLKFGEVEVMCDLRDALVTIDGQPQGRTPLARPILTRPGHHVLSLSRPGYRTVTRAIEVPPGGRQVLHFSLPK